MAQGAAGRAGRCLMTPRPVECALCGRKITRGQEYVQPLPDRYSQPVCDAACGATLVDREQAREAAMYGGQVGER